MSNDEKRDRDHSKPPMYRRPAFVACPDCEDRFIAPATTADIDCLACGATFKPLDHEVDT